MPLRYVDEHQILRLNDISLFNNGFCGPLSPTMTTVGSVNVRELALLATRLPSPPCELGSSNAILSGEACLLHAPLEAVDGFKASLSYSLKTAVSC